MQANDPSFDSLGDLDECWQDENAIVDGVPVRDWRAIVDYLTNSDTPEMHAITACRLITDRAFAEFAHPIVTMWRAPHPGLERDHAAGWADVKLRAAINLANRSRLH